MCYMGCQLFVHCCLSDAFHFLFHIILKPCPMQERQKMQRGLYETLPEFLTQELFSTLLYKPHQYKPLNS